MVARALAGENVAFRDGRIVAVSLLGFANAGAAPLSPEDKYIATRDAAIKKLSPLYDAGALDDAATKAEAAAFADLLVQMSAILKEPARKDFGPAKLNIETLYKGDEGFGMLDGLRFDAELGKAARKPATMARMANMSSPRPISSSQRRRCSSVGCSRTRIGGQGRKNVPQRIGSALKDESFYTQAISSGSAVINFNLLPMESL